MLEHYIRPSFQTYCVDPFLGILGRLGDPILLTITSAVLGILCVPLIAYQWNTFAITLLLLSGYLDIVDGSLARRQGMATDKGAVMDIISDRVVEFAALFGIYLVDPTHRATATILMLGSVLICITSFLVVATVTQNNSQKSFYYSPGLMERAEAFIFFIAMIALPQYFSLFATAFTLLVFWTAVKRVSEFYLRVS